MKRKMIWVLALVVFTAITLITLIVFVSIRMNEVHQKMQMARFQTESSCMLMALSNYVNTFGAIPSDTNAAMLSALIGQNSNRMVFLYVKTNRINSFGEYTDFWKTPYLIQVTNQGSLLIRSAGKNRLFGDEDDLSFEQSFAIPNPLSPSQPQ